MNDIQMLVDIAGMTAELIEKGKLVPVVRCKDCKHGEPGACGYGVDCDGVWHNNDWFCADGDQK